MKEAKLSYIKQYTMLHQDHPGYGAGNQHFEYILVLLQMVNAQQIVDWGCGKGRLADSLTALKLKCTKYDPAIPEYSQLPAGKYDVTLSTDVLEHIPCELISDVLSEMARSATSAIVIPHLSLATTILPDGTNAHCTIKTPDEWMLELRVFYSIVEILPHHSSKHAMFWCSNTHDVTQSSKMLCKHLADEKILVAQLRSASARARAVKVLRFVLGDGAVRLIRSTLRKFKT